jgi:hypothetical protein
MICIFAPIPLLSTTTRVPVGKHFAKDSPLDTTVQLPLAQPFVCEQCGRHVTFAESYGNSSQSGFAG